MVDLGTASLPLALREVWRMNPRDPQAACESATSQMAGIIDELLLDPAAVQTLVVLRSLRGEDMTTEGLPGPVLLSFRAFLQHARLGWCLDCFRLLVWWPNGASSEFPEMVPHRCEPEPETETLALKGKQQGGFRP